MNEELYSDLALEQTASSKFGLKLEIDHVIAREIPVGRSARASVFLTTKKQLYALVDGETNLLLADIKKIINRMGLKAELYLPPKGQPTYFDDVALEKFTEVFPYRHNPTTEDLIYYRTLAPYKPALVQIMEVKNGEIYQYDTDSHGGWRPVAKFAYRRILTSR